MVEIPRAIAEPVKSVGPVGITPNVARELDLIGDWGVLVTDSELAIAGWNSWLEQHVGRQATEFVGRKLFDVFPNLLIRKLDRYYQQALDGQTVLLSHRLHKYVLPLSPSVETSRFEFMQQRARIIPLVEGGAVCGTVTMIEDVTERVAYEDELRERVEMLREADRRKDDFLAMLAHELRNPLAPIANTVHLLRRVDYLNLTLLESARGMIERQVNHLVRLVDDLLDVSRVSRGKIQLQKGLLDLTSVAHLAVETSRPLIDARRHRLNVTLPPEPVCVEGDFMRLAQAVSNLLNNAAKYSDEGGEIWLTIETTRSALGTSEKAVIRVRDIGRGIEPGSLGSIFELFYQVGTNLDRSDGGLGIGLSLVKSLVEMHGGQVEAHSAGRGKGSEFIVYLPLTKVEGSSESSSSAVQPEIVRPARVLVVDDAVDSADSIAMILRLEGHTVWTAYDGTQAFAVASQERPDVVLLDIGLPHVNGYETCRRMRQGVLIDALIVAITGYGQKEDRLKSREAGFNAHLVKPVDLGTLRKLLAQRSGVR